MRKAMLATCCLVAILWASVPALAFEPRIDPEANRVFKEMCDYIAGLRSFSVEEVITEDKVYPDGQKIEFRKTSRVRIKRPDKLKAETLGDGGKTVVVINGPRFYLHKGADNVWGEFSVPPNLDAALDDMLAKLDVNAPSSDLFKDDPYGAIMPGVLSGILVGATTIDGRPCRHLAFRQLEVDWQIFVAEGDKPLPVLAVITDKTLHGNPQHRIAFTKWDIKEKNGDKTFDFTPPDGAQKVELLAPDAPAPGN